MTTLELSPHTALVTPQDGSVPILFSGLTASAKTNYSKLLAQSLDRPHIQAMCKLVRMVGITPGKESVWTTDAAEHIQAARDGDDVDRRLDSELLHAVELNPSVVVDARATPWLWGGGAIRIFVTADEDTRVKRCLASYAADASPSQDDARELLRAKDQYDIDLFRRLYGFDLEKDHDNFDIVLDTSGFIADTPEKTGRQLCQERIFPQLLSAVDTMLSVNA